jgi:geranylgeranyl diphosphate synthase, type II
MLVAAYDSLNKIDTSFIRSIITIFNQTARQVCEGQQLDMDFEKKESVGLEEYIEMIGLKTSVLMAASLKMGAIIGGAGERNQNLLYEFGRKLGIAFQVQDDYLDAFGDPIKFGKQVGGDIISNKKTFLLIHTLETATGPRKKELETVLNGNGDGKVEKVINIYRDAGVDEWAIQLKNKYLDEAMGLLEDIAVLSKRKQPLKDFAQFLIKREH